MKDYDEVFDLWKATPGVGLRSMDDSREGIEQFLRRNPTTNFVAVEDEQIVGVILGGHDGRRGAIYHACVREAYRRCNIAAKMMDCLIEAMKKENITRIALVCYKNNEAGNHFWSAYGFQNVRIKLLYICNR
jgi:ribosomal protein S18 acetylase RimI-like enzyme